MVSLLVLENLVSLLSPRENLREMFIGCEGAGDLLFYAGGLQR
jgi:hypothetical protein